MGSMGQRYRIHITNPTSARMEVVVSVDGQAKDRIDKENPTFFTLYPTTQDGQVISQSVAAGTYQQRGATIVIAYYKAK